MVATISHDMHRKRRGAMANFFSKQSVRNVEPAIQSSLNKLLSRMERASQTDEKMPLMYIFKAATSDIITKYAFGKSTNFMDMDNYNMPFFQAIEVTFLMSPALMHFAWLGPLMEALPDPIVKLLMPGLADMWRLRKVLDCPLKKHKQKADKVQGWMAQIDDIKNSPNFELGRGTIFEGVLKSKLPEEEKQTARLGHEAQLTVLAGQDTTGKLKIYSINLV
jgi:cytochrome P450